MTIKTPWADSPIHDQIREAGLDTAECSYMKRKIRIPVVAGSNGMWNATGVRDGEQPDWGLLSDFLDCGGEYPATEKRFWVEAEIEFPDAEEVVQGAVSKEND